jgi:hypothetical protein
MTNRWLSARRVPMWAAVLATFVTIVGLMSAGLSLPAAAASAPTNVRAWGDNSLGDLGIGQNRGFRDVPVMPKNLGVVKIVAFEAPDRAQRVAMVKMKLRTVRHDLVLASIADRLDGYTHAGIERVCEDAMRLMVRIPDRAITQRHLDYGIERQEARRETILGSQA